jgi:hypothetical protein
MVLVKSLQRALVGTTLVVGVGVGVVGFKMWQTMRATIRVVAEKAIDNVEETPTTATVSVTRVLVKRRKDDPTDKGEVVETQYLGHVKRNLDNVDDSDDNRRVDGIVSKVKVVSLDIANHPYC